MQKTTVEGKYLVTKTWNFKNNNIFFQKSKLLWFVESNHVVLYMELQWVKENKTDSFNKI